MPITLITISLAIVFVASGVLKLRQGTSGEDWAALGVPLALNHTWLRNIHPWVEVLLGLALLLLGSWLGFLAALGFVAMSVAYVVLISKALRADGDAECACFGTTAPITGITLARNIWLLALSVLAAVFIWQTPLWGGTLRTLDLTGWGWVLGAAIAAVTTALVLLSQQAAPAVQSTPTGLEDIDLDEEEGDYIRRRTPSVPMIQADGAEVNIRRLSQQKPQLLFAVSEHCFACQEVIAQLPSWQERLPQLELRLLLSQRPEDSGLTSTEEPQTLHDMDANFRNSIEDWRVPTAVLLGMDGLLAGGPVTGTAAVKEFVDDVEATLNE